MVLRNGRPLDPVGDPDGARRMVGRLVEAGATGLQLWFVHHSLAHYLEQLEAHGRARRIGVDMNRVKVGFFSLHRHSPTGDDRPYLEWHQLDHMPEQYQLPGLVAGPAVGLHPGLPGRPCRRGGRLVAPSSTWSAT